MTETTVGADDVPEKPVPPEVVRLRAATSSPVAEEIVMGLLAALYEANQEIGDLQGIQAERDQALRRVETLEAERTPMARFRDIVQEAHTRARHVGPWNACPHPVCREIEDQLLAVRKGYG